MRASRPTAATPTVDGGRERARRQHGAGGHGRRRRPRRCTARTSTLSASATDAGTGVDGGDVRALRSGDAGRRSAPTTRAVPRLGGTRPASRTASTRVRRSRPTVRRSRRPRRRWRRARRQHAAGGVRWRRRPRRRCTVRVSPERERDRSGSGVTASDLLGFSWVGRGRLIRSAAVGSVHRDVGHDGTRRHSTTCGRSRPTRRRSATTRLDRRASTTPRRRSRCGVATARTWADRSC